MRIIKPLRRITPALLAAAAIVLPAAAAQAAPSAAAHPASTVSHRVLASGSFTDGSSTGKWDSGRNFSALGFHDYGEGHWTHNSVGHTFQLRIACINQGGNVYTKKSGVVSSGTNNKVSCDLDDGGVDLTIRYDTHTTWHNLCAGGCFAKSAGATAAASAVTLGARHLACTPDIHVHRDVGSTTASWNFKCIHAVQVFSQWNDGVTRFGAKTVSGKASTVNEPSVDPTLAKANCVGKAGYNSSGQQVYRIITYKIPGYPGC